MRLCSMLIGAQGVRWTTTNRDGSAQLDISSPLPDGLNVQQLVELSIQQALPDGGTVVLMDNDHATYIPDHVGATPLCAPHLMEIGGARIHTVTPHQALAAQIARARCNLTMQITQQLVDPSLPYGLARVVEFNGNLTISVSTIGTDGVPMANTAAVLIGSPTTALATAADVIEMLTREMQYGPGYTNIRVSYEYINNAQPSGESRTAPTEAGIGLELHQLLLARFITANIGMELRVEPMATLSGGLLLASDFAA